MVASELLHVKIRVRRGGEGPNLGVAEFLRVEIRVRRGSLQQESRHACVRHVFPRVSGHDGAAGEGPNLVALEFLRVKIRVRRGGSAT